MASSNARRRAALMNTVKQTSRDDHFQVPTQNLTTETSPVGASQTAIAKVPEVKAAAKPEPSSKPVVNSVRSETSENDKKSESTPVQDRTSTPENHSAESSKDQKIVPLVIEVKPLDGTVLGSTQDEQRPGTWIAETDLQPSSSGGVYGLFKTNLPMVEYPEDADYNTLLPFDMSKGFNDQFERRILMITPTQSQFFKDLCPLITREFKRNASPEQRRVRSNAQSPLLRLIVDFFIHNAPSGCFDGVTGEQSLRANLGMAPLPELEIYDHEVKKSNVKYGALKKRLETTDYKPEVSGVFNGWKTTFTSPAYSANTSYAKLAQLNFPQGFVSGMHRVQVAFTATQLAQLKKMENYLNQQIESHRDPSQARVDRKSPPSALYRTMFDFFYSHAQAERLKGVSDEQTMRSMQGIQPLPELTLYVHEKNKLG